MPTNQPLDCPVEAQQAARASSGAAEPLLSEATQAGEQTLVPGVKPISQLDRLALLADAPLRPRKLQQPLDIGLFDLAARSQLDLFAGKAR